MIYFVDARMFMEIIPFCQGKNTRQDSQVRREDTVYFQILQKARVAGVLLLQRTVLNAVPRNASWKRETFFAVEQCYFS